MTTRLKGVLVTFDQDIREDDAEPLLDAIRCLRHVADVSPVPSNIDDHITRRLVKLEVLQALREMTLKMLETGDRG